MIAELLLLVTYCSTLLLPGYILQRKLNFNQNWFLASLGISYALFALSFVVANYFSISACYFITTYSVLLILCASYLITYLLLHQPKFSNEIKPVLAISLGSILYQSAFGSFTEVPADLYAHMERYQYALTNISNNSLGMPLEWSSLFSQKSGVFYYLIAVAAFIAEPPAHSIIATVDFANRTLFIIAVYFFTKVLFRDSSNSKIIASLACVFVVLHMGINIFAYIRYYSLAPTTLNMVIYFAAVSLFIEIIKTKPSRKMVSAYVLLILLIATAAAIHVQEAMYIVLIVGGISVLGTLSKFSFIPNNFETNTTQVITIATLGLLGLITIYTYSHLNLPRAENAHWRLWEFGSGFGLIPDITTLNLKFQFSRVITLWGVVVYALFILNIKRYRSNIFIMAGMLSPLATILNPFFVDLFLRHYNSTTLWRLCFIIPIHFVAADLFVHYFTKLKQEALPTKAFSVFILLTLVGLLFPFKNTWQGIHYSRFPTLGASSNSLSHYHYKDLVYYLDSKEEPHQILTDPMTGYMITGMTKHINIRHKFFRGYRFKNFTFESYSDSPLTKYKGYLLITNQRSQAKSHVGELSGHWRKDQWQQKNHYYTPSLMSHLTQNPKRFSLLWQNDGIAVYKIN